MGELTYINNLIDKRYDTYEVLRRKYGIVKEVINESKAVVTLEDKDMSAWQKEYKRRAKEKKEAEERGEEPPKYENDGTRDLTLINATGENLAGGDSVWVYYWHDLASGYIALRAGLSDNAVEMPPLNIGKLGVYSSEQADLYMPPYTYYGSAAYADYEARLVNVDEQNGIDIHQGDSTYGFNTIFVDGFPCIILPGDTTKWRQIMLTVDPNLFSREVNLRVYQTETSSQPAINPDVDTNISIGLMQIDSVSGNQGTERRYRFGRCMQYKDIEGMSYANDTESSPESEIMVFDTPQIDNKNVKILLATFGTLIHEPTPGLPYGSIDVFVMVKYNATQYYVRVGYFGTIRVAFQNIAEYEFALCMIRRCDVIQEVVQGG